MFDKDPRTKIEKAIEDKTTTEPYRKYLGVSQLGHPCIRALFYQFRFYLKPREITAREKRLFSRGHREEPILLADLEKEGVRIISTQDEVSTCDGHILGHVDAILGNMPDAPKTDHLGEFKTSATKYFNALAASRSVKKSFPSHYDQLQGYMHLTGLTRCLYICVNKEDDRRYYDRIDYDKKYCEILFEKAESVVFATVPPHRIGDSSYYRCGPKWCDYRNICHFGELKTINHTCRSCKNIEIHDKGRWYCLKKKEFRSFKKQQKGCKKWSLLGV